MLRPVSLPVVAGPYIRCPPALHPAGSAMLSRSRCVSRAFSRSLSAFQKVRSGRAGAPMGAEPGCGWTGRLKGRDAVCWPGQAPRAPGRGGCRRPRSRPAACVESRSPCLSHAARAGRLLLSRTLCSGAGSRARSDIDLELIEEVRPPTVFRGLSPPGFKTSACQSRGEVDIV